MNPVPAQTAHSTSQARALAIVATVGINLSLVHYFALMEFPALLGSNELVALIALGAYFLGLSLGYLVSDRISRYGLTAIGIGTLMFYVTLPYLPRLMVGWFWEVQWPGVIPPFVFLIVLCGITPFYAVFLPRLIQSAAAGAGNGRERRQWWLVKLYATEIGGGLAGLLLAVLFTPANMRLILTTHLAGLVVLVALGSGSSWRRVFALLAPLPALYLGFAPALDRATLSYCYEQKLSISWVNFLASEFSPYQRVDIFEQRLRNGTNIYLYLNGNLYYGSPLLYRHNLFVSILPNLMAPRPSNALVIGGGSLDNARYLAPRVGRLHVVELDQTVVRLTREHIQERRGQFPTNWSLTIDDGKHFLGNYDGPPFDVISIDVPMPTFLQTAMLHSDRFFALARTRLAPGGIFSVSLCGTCSAEKPGDRPGAARVSNRVMAGLLKNFRHVIVMRSDDRDFAWASDAPIPFAADQLLARATEFVKETRTLHYFGTFEIELLDPKEVRSWAQGYAPIGEADMQVVLRLSISKLMDSYFEDSE
ncbi:MAG TPA: hypothetical protein VGK40_06415 [Verrucomicrobiae bacterium]